MTRDHASVSPEPEFVLVDNESAAALRKALEAAMADPAPIETSVRTEVSTSRRRRSRQRPNGAHRRPIVHPPPDPARP
jgi:hypothetical protein